MICCYCLHAVNNNMISNEINIEKRVCPSELTSHAVEAVFSKQADHQLSVYQNGFMRLSWYHQTLHHIWLSKSRPSVKLFTSLNAFGFDRGQTCFKYRVNHHPQFSINLLSFRFLKFVVKSFFQCLSPNFCYNLFSSLQNDKNFATLHSATETRRVKW